MNGAPVVTLIFGSGRIALTQFVRSDNHIERPLDTGTAVLINTVKGEADNLGRVVGSNVGRDSGERVPEILS